MDPKKQISKTDEDDVKKKLYLEFSNNASIQFPDICVNCGKSAYNITLEIPIFTKPELSQVATVFKGVNILLGLAMGGLGGAMGGAYLGNRFKKHKIIQKLNTKICADCLRNLSHQIDTRPETAASTMIFQIDADETSCRISSDSRDFLTALAAKNPETILSHENSSITKLLSITNDRPSPHDDSYRVCWFCNRNDAETGCTLQIEMNKITNREQTRKLATWLTIRMSIPRCKQCKALHLIPSKQILQSWIIGAILGIPAIFLISWILDWEFPNDIWEFFSYILFGAILGGAGLGSVSEILQKRKSPPRSEKAIIEAFQGLGWKMGAEPPE
jgi:hypothetical protein